MQRMNSSRRRENTAHGSHRIFQRGSESQRVRCICKGGAETQVGWICKGCGRIAKASDRVGSKRKRTAEAVQMRSDINTPLGVLARIGFLRFRHLRWRDGSRVHSESFLPYRFLGYQSDIANRSMLVASFQAVQPISQLSYLCLTL